MATHVKVIGALFIVIAALCLLGAVLIPIGFGFVAAIVGASGDKDAGTVATVFGLTGAFVGVLLGLFAVPYAIASYGLLKFRPWGRIMAIIMAAMLLIKIPFGTLIGIYALVVLFQKDTERLFAAVPAA